MSAVEVRDLVKVFPKRGGGEVRAVDGISFAVEEGEIFGFLGPNGAGKTTSLEIMEGLQKPTSGEARVLGVNSTTHAEELKRRIGIQLQASAYFDYLTLREILDLFGSFYPARLEADGLLARVNLTEKADSLVRQLSGGQQQRFSIIASLVNDPQVVFLDEATTGLDPRARRDVWDLVRDIRSSGKTVVLTTHYMEEAETLCDRIAIIDLGKIVALDTPRALIQTLGASYRIVFETRNGVDMSAVASLPGVTSSGPARGRPDAHELSVRDPLETLPTFLAWVRQQNVELADLQIVTATLEDVFLARTGHGLGDGDETEGHE